MPARSSPEGKFGLFARWTAMWRREHHSEGRNQAATRDRRYSAERHNGLRPIIMAPTSDAAVLSATSDALRAPPTRRALVTQFSACLSISRSHVESQGLACSTRVPTSGRDHSTPRRYRYAESPAPGGRLLRHRPLGRTAKHVQLGRRVRRGPGPSPRRRHGGFPRRKAPEHHSRPPRLSRAESAGMLAFRRDCCHRGLKTEMASAPA